MQQHHREATANKNPRPLRIASGNTHEVDDDDISYLWELTMSVQLYITIQLLSTRGVTLSPHIAFNATRCITHYIRISCILRLAISITTSQSVYHLLIGNKTMSTYSSLSCHHLSPTLSFSNHQQSVRTVSSI